MQTPSQLDTFARHPKDPTPPSVSSRGLAQECPKLVKKVDQQLWQSMCAQPPLQKLVDLYDGLGGIVLVEFFAGLCTGLAALLKAGLIINNYTYVDNNAMVKKVAKHHLKLLQVRYRKQLLANAIQGCMS